MSEPDSDSPVTLLKKVWVFAIVLVVFFVAIFVIIFYRKTLPYVSKDTLVMGTYMKILLGSKNNPYTMIDTMIREVKRIENKYSFREKSSILSEINQNGENWSYVDEETRFILERSYELAVITNGAFDPVLGRLTMLWGFDQLDQEGFQFTIPSEEAIRKALQQSGFKNLEFEGEKVRLLNFALIDLGAIVKGYAIDRCIQIAKEMDSSVTGYIDIGGDIGIIGAKFGGSHWIIGIQHPRFQKATDVIATVFMKSGAIATSGDYQRFFEIQGKRYHHILDPETGSPASELISSTVISANSMDADALATAAFVLGSDFALQILPRLGGQAFLIDSNLQPTKTSGWSFFEKAQ